MRSPRVPQSTSSTLPPPPAATVKAKTALEQAFEACAGPKEALALLQASFDRGQYDVAALKEMVALCKALQARWPEGYYASAANKLISECCVELGEKTEAQAAFLAYADSQGTLLCRRRSQDGAGVDNARREGEALTAHLIDGEAQTLLSRKQDDMALRYCDVLIARYPGQAVVSSAYCTMALYCHRQEQPRQQAEYLKRAIANGPTSPAAQQARLLLPEALCKMGEREEAAKVWLEVAATARDKRTEATAYYQAAQLLKKGTPSEMAQARQLLEKVKSEYAQTNYATLASRSLERLDNPAAKRATEPAERNLKRVPGIKDGIDVLGM